nr:zinc ABC transporter substrate-binding protein [Desulfobulbaceae bacterium]
MTHKNDFFRMFVTRYKVVCYAVFLGIALWSTHSMAAPKSLTVITSVPPHAFIVEQLAAGQVEVISLVDRSSDPHTYEPTPKQMLAISRASIFFASGLEFERTLLEKINSVNRKLAVVNLAIMEDADHDEHIEEADHDEHIDQHSWLSPTLYSSQAEIVYNTLLKHLPEQSEAITLGHDHFQDQLSKTAQQVRKLLEPYRGRVFYVFHPAFGHFGEVYGLQQRAVEVGSKRPTAKQLQAIIKQSKSDMVKVIFSQPQFDQRSAAVVAAAIDGKIMVLDPMAKDLFANYLAIAESFVDSFQ